ncbi:MAG: isoprenylcysteine carboxylmethyltransferase family protein [Psychrosphaera sp.]|nr:isoprenylcysteine carboxylmethyltransferase family protein [Psychrosphaera sp.]
MELIFKWVLLSYFVLFISIALLYRTYRVYKTTGINALKQKPQERSLKLLAVALKVHFVLIVGLIVDHSFNLGVLTTKRIECLDSTFTSPIGAVLLCICLPVIVLSQVQMSSSWRIEVDSQTNNELITLGLFKYSRNPIFLAIRTSYFAMFLVVPCPYSLAVFIFGDICFMTQVYKEEQALKQVYGADYQHYCDRVPRWI